MALRHQAVADVRTDEAGSSGDQHPVGIMLHSRVAGDFKRISNPFRSGACRRVRDFAKGRRASGRPKIGLRGNVWGDGRGIKGKEGVRPAPFLLPARPAVRKGRPGAARRTPNADGRSPGGSDRNPGRAGFRRNAVFRAAARTPAPVSGVRACAPAVRWNRDARKTGERRSPPAGKAGRRIGIEAWSAEPLSAI